MIFNHMLNQFDTFPFNGMECPSNVIDKLHVWQQNNSKRFANAEIFREEFFKYAKSAIEFDFSSALNRMSNRFKQENDSQLEKIQSQHKDTWYVVQELVREVAKLTEELQAQKPAPLKSKKKK